MDKSINDFEVTTIILPTIETLSFNKMVNRIRNANEK